MEFLFWHLCQEIVCLFVSLFVCLFIYLFVCLFDLFLYFLIYVGVNFTASIVIDWIKTARDPPAFFSPVFNNINAIKIRQEIHTPPRPTCFWMRHCMTIYGIRDE